MYTVVFVMGVVCSITVMLLLTRFPSTTRKVPNYLSDVHYLQVRDDYSLYSLSSDDSKEAAIHRHDKMGRKRNSVEGKIYKQLHMFDKDLKTDGNCFFLR